MLERVFKLTEEFKHNNSIYKTSLSSHVQSGNSWTAPPLNVIKINVDALQTDEGWIGMGIVARNHEGHVLLTASRRVKAYWHPEITEG